METLKTLPDLQGRKFGALSFGYDRVEQIRMEFGILESLAAMLLGCTREDVTVPKVQRLIAEVNSRRAMLSEEDTAKAEGLETTDLLALALAKQPT